MTTTYGARTPTFGRQQPRRSLLASALAGPSPISSGTFRAGLSGSAGYPVLRPPRAPASKAPVVKPQQTAAPVNPRGVEQNTAPTPGVYDLNTDPILQQITALSGRSDEAANAGALKQRQQLLIGYGDPALSRAVLGDETQAQAAGQNPTSIIAQLRTQHDRGLSALEDALNKANLWYSGYRVNQEGQAAQDYQGALAGASGQAQGGLDTIASNLAAALSQNQAQRAQAAQDAYDRQLQMALMAPPDYTGLQAPAGGGSGYTDLTDPWQAVMAASDQWTPDQGSLAGVPTYQQPMSYSAPSSSLDELAQQLLRAQRRMV